MPHTLIRCRVCPRPVCARGLCRMHYERQRPDRYEPVSPIECDECGKVFFRRKRTHCPCCRAELPRTPPQSLLRHRADRERQMREAACRT